MARAVAASLVAVMVATALTVLRATEAASCVSDCPRDIEPVCASDGITYGNTCLFQYEKCRSQNTALTIMAKTACASSNSSTVKPSVAPTPSPAVLTPKPTGVPATSKPASTPTPTTRSPSVSATSSSSSSSSSSSPTPTTKAPSTMNSSSNNSNCTVSDCAGVLDLVCGSDGNTYFNRCELTLAACKDSKLKIVQNGTCHQTDATTSKSDQLDAASTNEAVPDGTANSDLTGTKQTPGQSSSTVQGGGMASPLANDGVGTEEVRWNSSPGNNLDVATMAGIAVGLACIMLLLILLRKQTAGVIKMCWDGIFPRLRFVEPEQPTTLVERSAAQTHSLWEEEVIVAARIPREKVITSVLVSRGGSNEVYRGKFNGKHVAIKMLLPETRSSLKHINTFLGEIKLMATLNHERIVRFIGVAWDSLTDLCVVSEFMGGGDLRSLLTRFDEFESRPHGFDAQKLKIALQVAHALTYLHSLDPVVLHRDLKSRNILLTSKLEAKISDFGISRERSDLTMTGGVGTCLWMAPEVVMGERYDDKADIFSFGVVLSELDSHCLPYAHAAIGSFCERRLPDAAVIQLVSAGTLRVQFSSNASPAMVALGNACVSLDPANRPSAAEVLYKLHLMRSEIRASARW